MLLLLPIIHIESLTISRHSITSTSSVLWKAGRAFSFVCFLHFGVPNHSLFSLTSGGDSGRFTTVKVSPELVGHWIDLLLPWVCYLPCAFHQRTHSDLSRGKSINVRVEEQYIEPFNCTSLTRCIASPLQTPIAAHLDHRILRMQLYLRSSLHAPEAVQNLDFNVSQ